MEFYWTKKGGGLAGVLILLLAMCLVWGGCESDSVAPDDEVPALTERDVAQQAALVAVGLSKAGPEILNYSGKKPRDKDDVVGVYLYPFEGEDITGSVILEYFTGGAEGVHCPWDEADYGLVYTPDDEMVSVVVELPGGAEPQFGLTFNLFGPIDRAADTAEVAGSGVFSSVAYTNDFTIPEASPVILTEFSSYPDGGEINFTVGAISLVVTYDGDSTAGVDVAGVLTYEIDLITGGVTLVE
jgi:hypothetical protein